MDAIESKPTTWSLRGGKLALELDKKTGRVSSLQIGADRPANWCSTHGQVTVRDDLLRKTFDHRDLVAVEWARRGNRLIMRRRFRGAPWVLQETYTARPAAIRWEAEVVLDKGVFRSCASVTGWVRLLLQAANLGG